MPPVPFPRELAQAISDPNFKRDLQKVIEIGKNIWPEVDAAARKKGDKGHLYARIAERCHLALMGVKMAASTGGSGLTKPGPAGPPQNPPVMHGMMYCLGLVEKIVRTDFRAGDMARLAKLPALLKRIRHLLRVYYDFVVGGRQHSDLIFCDWDSMLLVALMLHQAGLCFQLEPLRLRAAMAASNGELEKFFLDDELDIGLFRQTAFVLERYVEADPESEDTDRMAAGDVEDAADDDLTAHVMSWLLGDVLVAFIMEDENTGSSDSRRWAGKAMTRLVEWSTSKTIRTTLGDALTDAMRPIYWTPSLLVRFSHAGGLGALFGDWTNSTCRNLCEDILNDMPEAVWDNQTPASLAVVTRELQTKVNSEGSVIAKTPIFINAFLNMYRRHSLAPFHAAARLENFDSPVIFYYLSHRIKQDSLPMLTLQDWLDLVTTYIDMPHSTERRYHWSNMTVSARWDCMELYGCSAEGCPEKRELRRLRERR
ncbi:MYND-type domain-containing protein, partial [Favolaschia claudopus]